MNQFDMGMVAVDVLVQACITNLLVMVSRSSIVWCFSYSVYVVVSIAYIVMVMIIC